MKLNINQTYQCRALLRQMKGKTLICLVIPEQLETEYVDCVIDTEIMFCQETEIGNDSRLNSLSFRSVLSNFTDDTLLFSNK